MPETRDWSAMRATIRKQLVRRTGRDVPEWNARIREVGFADEAELHGWLTREGVTGYPRMLLIMERFGYPAFMLTSADRLVEAQYASAPELRAIYDTIIRRVSRLGDVVVQARKTYVSLVTPRRTFARIKPCAHNAVAMALRLDSKPDGRLRASRIHESMPVELVFRAPSDVDADAMRWISRACSKSR